MSLPSFDICHTQPLDQFWILIDILQYQHLRTLRKDFPDVPIMALTASATPEVQAHIIEGLQLRPDHLFLTQSFNRPNLHYSVRKKPGGNLARTIAEYIKERHPGKAGVIYCTGRDTCERVAKDLRVLGIKARHFHAKMVDADKQKTLQDWKDGLSDVIVATVSRTIRRLGVSTRLTSTIIDRLWHGDQ